MCRHQRKLEQKQQLEEHFLRTLSQLLSETKLDPATAAVTSQSTSKTTAAAPSCQKCNRKGRPCGMCRRITAAEAAVRDYYLAPPALDDYKSDNGNEKIQFAPARAPCSKCDRKGGRECCGCRKARRACMKSMVFLAMTTGRVPVAGDSARVLQQPQTVFGTTDDRSTHLPAPAATRASSTCPPSYNAVMMARENEHNDGAGEYEWVEKPEGYAPGLEYVPEHAEQHPAFRN